MDVRDTALAHVFVYEAEKVCNFRVCMYAHVHRHCSEMCGRGLWLMYSCMKLKRFVLVVYVCMHMCLRIYRDTVVRCVDVGDTALAHVCMHACMHVCMYVCMYVCMFTALAHVFVYEAEKVCSCGVCMYAYVFAHI